MSWLNASLPIWIIGAPLVFAIIDWMRTPKVTTTHDARRGAALAQNT